MVKDLILEQILFEVNDVFGKRIRTTKLYWEKIKSEKHRELEFEKEDVVIVLQNPDEVYRSVTDDYIRLFLKKFEHETLIVVVKYLNGDGFVITSYQTSKEKRKGEKLWPK